MEKMNFCEKHNTNEIKGEKKFIYCDNSDGGKIILGAPLKNQKNNAEILAIFEKGC